MSENQGIRVLASRFLLPQNENRVFARLSNAFNPIIFVQSDGHGSCQGSCS